jgi:hypothetical protein
MGLIEPLIAVLLGAVFLDERLGFRTAAGGVLILIAVGVVLDLRGTAADAAARQKAAGRRENAFFLCLLPSAVFRLAFGFSAPR